MKANEKIMDIHKISLWRRGLLGLLSISLTFNTTVVMAMEDYTILKPIQHLGESLLCVSSDRCETGWRIEEGGVKKCVFLFLVF